MSRRTKSGYRVSKSSFPIASLPVVSLTVAALLLGMSAAQASVKGAPPSLTREVASYMGFGPDQANNPTDPALVPEHRALLPSVIEPAHVTVATPPLPALARETPRVEYPLRKIFCVEYARLRSGLAVFGDAKHWWARAKNLYARAAHPVEEAVMVFSGSKRLKRGHVAVVTRIVSAREVIVDQANWMNKGEIDIATPVLDVSKHNDWSKVRVWDIPSGQFGTRVYAVSGFIAKGLTRQARND